MTWHISMSLRSLLGPGEESLAASCLDGEQSAPSKSSPTAGKSSCGGKTKGTSRRSQYGTTCERLMELSGAGKWMSSLEDSHARTSQSQAKAQESTESEAGPGQRWQGSLAKYDPVSRSWKTAQRSLIEDWTEYPATWPRWGTTVGGELYLLPTLAPAITEKGFGYLPTPDASLGAFEGAMPMDAVSCFRKQESGQRPSGSKIGSSLRWHPEFIHEALRTGGELNPEWIEALMRWPIGWTDSKPLATRRMLEWQQQHGAFSEAHKSF